jgi:low temperature requirement protein LtrA
MNFTWLASAYDTDDGLYRLNQLMQIAGVLILAAGVPRAFDARDFGVIALGYVVARLAMVAQWLRAAVADPSRRRCTLRYAIGITLLQVLWVGWLALPAGWLLPSFAVLAVGELLVPVWAERAAPTTWHPHHIAERYGLFTLIVLGETVLAATTAIQAALEAGHGDAALFSLAGAGLIIVFSMWWLYFDRPDRHLLDTLRTAIVWGYGHLLIFASAAAVGAGLAVAVDLVTGEAHVPAVVAGLATSVPVALYLVAVWALQLRANVHGATAAAFPLTAALILAAAATPLPVHLTALLLAALAAATALATRRVPSPAARAHAGA